MIELQKLCFYDLRTFARDWNKISFYLQKNDLIEKNKTIDISKQKKEDLV